MKESSPFKHLITLLLDHIRVIVLFFFIGAAAGFSAAKYVLPLKYVSHISIYVQSYTDIKDDVYDLYDNPYKINNINNSKQLVNTYIEVLLDDTIMDEIGKLLSDEFDRETLAENFIVSGKGEIATASIRNCLSASSKSDTSAIKVVAVARNPEVAAFLCNALIKVAPDYMMKAVGVGSINTIGTAKTYYSPVSPNVFKTTAAGAAAGVILIVVIIYLIDYFDNTVRDADALKERFRKAMIGEILQFGEFEHKRGKNKRHDEDRRFKLTDEKIPFDIVESYKSIRTNVTFSLSTNKRKILSISSANRCEGKSTVTSNLAIAMAQSGSKVLLIDADMRKSAQHTIFDLPNDKGLSTAVCEMDPLDACIQKNVMENLDIMTAGPAPPNPSELLASERMGLILNELHSRYSIIIIDTPPVNVVTDAMILAKYGSSIIMVVRYGSTTTDDLKAANEKIEFAEANMLGYILNGAQFKPQGGYYGKRRHRRSLYQKGRGYDSDYRFNGYVKKINTDSEQAADPETDPERTAIPDKKSK